MKLDILAFGAHPDDIELSCAGLLLVEKANGKNIGAVDLTEGELGSRGSIETRYEESSNASKILNLDVRENLKLEDGFFKNDKETQIKIITAIRKYRPEIVLCNAVEDRHPDHGRASQLVSDSCFLSGLFKIETEDNNAVQKAWRPKYVFHYIQDRYIDPDFIVDITSVFEKKLESIKAYKTQFHNPDVDGPETYISKPQFLEQLISSNQVFGKKIGVTFGEGFTTPKKIGLKNLDAFILHNT
jgi:bacillithiol biosynthesis deacetylase BshB1